jgi:hypothetical protein
VVIAEGVFAGRDCKNRRVVGADRASALFSAEERKEVKQLHRIGKFYVFLREMRHQLCDASFEAALAKAYKKPRGTAPVPPALLAMVTLNQRGCGLGPRKEILLV